MSLYRRPLLWSPSQPCMPSCAVGPPHVGAKCFKVTTRTLLHSQLSAVDHPWTLITLTPRRTPFPGTRIRIRSSCRRTRHPSAGGATGSHSVTTVGVSTLFPPVGIGLLVVNTTDASPAEVHHPQSVELEPPARRNLSIGEPSSDLHVMEHVRPVKLPPSTEAPLDEASANAMDETIAKLRFVLRLKKT
ncbi:uncharacterized protein LOC124162470 [Ischnura elegans]|uniref:uncharacterized protein LOC124158250 n=1 Tax=Ischnura elegans TaxID=197161 RepID=UPI001ED8BF9E|nr:uncharacterized protein LOC124158250 [Ischnura elegans]XP_046394968.1 uncharacterized protein LOC124162470 [Ischnura elegans]